MIKDPIYLQKLEREFLAKRKVDIHKNLALLDSMYDLARDLGVFPLADPLAGIEKDIEISRILNRLPQ